MRMPGHGMCLQGKFSNRLVVLAPWVGAYADIHAKPKVMVNANLVKILGTGLMIASVTHAATAAMGAPPVETVAVLGVCIVLATLVIAMQLRRNYE